MYGPPPLCERTWSIWERVKSNGREGEFIVVGSPPLERVSHAAGEGQRNLGKAIVVMFDAELTAHSSSRALSVVLTPKGGGGMPQHLYW